MKRSSRKKITERARIFLQASVGEISVAEACKMLGISRQRYYELEDRAMQGFLKEIEPKKRGRPRKQKDPAAGMTDRIQGLEKENEKLWLYIKVLRELAGIEGRGKKAGRSKTKGPRSPGETHDR